MKFAVGRSGRNTQGVMFAGRGSVMGDLALVASADFTARLLAVVWAAEGLQVGPFPFVASFADGCYVVDFVGWSVAGWVFADGLVAEFGCSALDPAAAAGLTVAAGRGCWHACAWLAFGGWLLAAVADAWWCCWHQ